MVATLVGATIGVPYVVSHTSPGTTGAHHTAGNGSAAAPAPSLGTAPSSAAPTTPPPLASAAPSQLQIEGPGSLVYSSRPPLEGTRFHSVEQVLRFDVSKEWVYQNWARKSTGPTDVGLFAVRVPLVTGTQMSALAGSLTYYFNTQGQVEHISFRGRTGDTTQLVQFLTRKYQFQRGEASVGEQVYQVTSGSRAQSELRTRPESVLWTTSPHSSLAVELELARPGSARLLPPRAPALQIPAVASATPPAESASATDGTSAEDSSGSFFDKARYATPQEQGQVLWRRWPN